MIGTTLRALRQEIDALAEADGRFSVVCARSGEQPIPVAGRRFVSRSTARTALRAAEEYRGALRRYDPTPGPVDLIVCEGDGPNGDRPAGQPAFGERSAPATLGTRPRVEVCHDMAAALFEALAAREDDGLERAIMDDYVRRAERVADPDRLCCCLLSTAATRIGRRLTDAEQARLLTDTADRLPARPRNGMPVIRTGERLVGSGLIGAYDIRRETGPSACTLTVEGYVLDPADDGLPTLPISLGLRQRYDGAIGIPAVHHLGETDWRVDLDLRLDATVEPGGLFVGGLAGP